VKHRQGINFPRLTLTEKTEIKNLYRAAPDLVISQPSSSRILTYMRKFKLLCMLSISGSVAVLKEMLC
jgi:hypothetical protein